MSWPSVNPLAPIVAGVTAFIVGGVYWAVMSRFLISLPAVGSWPLLGLSYALGSRVVMAYALAIILGFTRASGARPGAMVGVLVWASLVFNFLVSQGAFGQLQWTLVAAGGAESLIGFALMGAVVGAWSVKSGEPRSGTIARAR